MNHQATISSILICLAFLSVASAQDVRSPAAKQAIAEYKRSVKRLDKLHHDAQIKINAKYQEEATTLKKAVIEKLEIAKDEQTKAANLDEAIAIRSRAQEILAKQIATPNNLIAKRSIPEKAIDFNGHHYLLVARPSKLSCSIIKCQEMGGHLLRVDSGKEHDFVLALMEKHSGISFWIDGSDLSKEGTWRHSNGVRIPYFDWAADEPNGRTTENYLEINSDRKMNDVPDKETTRYFICEWDQ